MVLGNAPPSEDVEKPKKAAHGRNGDGTTAGNGPRRARQDRGCRVAAEWMRIAAAAGFMVGLSDAAERTMGIDDDALIVGDLGEVPAR